MQLLDQQQIKKKIERLAIEILEHNYGERELILAGINNNGLGFAKMLHNRLVEHTEMTIHLTRIQLSPANPLASEVVIEKPAEELHGKVIIIVDDVANTGRTIFYAIKPLLNVLPKKVEVAVLVNRTHKSFPIQVDYVGLSLATTLQENIQVQILGKQPQAVFLE